MTLSVILSEARNVARSKGWQELAAEIEENYLIHKFKKGKERYKIFPRLRDRANYINLIEGNPTPDSQIGLALNYRSQGGFSDCSSFPA